MTAGRSISYTSLRTQEADSKRVVLLWIAAISLLLVLTSVQILGLTVPALIPHPGGEGPPAAAIISIVLGEGLMFIGGVIVGITTIRAQHCLLLSNFYLMEF